MGWKFQNGTQQFDILYVLSSFFCWDVLVTCVFESQVGFRHRFLNNGSLMPYYFFFFLQVLSDSETVRWLNHAVERIWPICMEQIASQKILLPIIPWFLEKYKPWTAVCIIFIILYIPYSGFGWLYLFGWSKVLFFWRFFMVTSCDLPSRGV